MSVANQTAATENTNTGADTQTTSTTSESPKMNNANTESTTNSTAGTAAGEAAKTGLLTMVKKYGLMLLRLAVSAVVIYFCGQAAMNYGTAFMNNGGLLNAAAATLATAATLTWLGDLLSPVGHFLRERLWVPAKAKFARKTADVAAATAEAAATTAATAEAAAGAAAAAV